MRGLTFTLALVHGNRLSTYNELTWNYIAVWIISVGGFTYIPTCSMYGKFTKFYPENDPSVGKYILSIWDLYLYHTNKYVYKCKWVCSRIGHPKWCGSPYFKEPKRIISGQLFENIPDAQTGAAATWKLKSTSLTIMFPFIDGDHKLNPHMFVCEIPTFWLEIRAFVGSFHHFLVKSQPMMWPSSHENCGAKSHNECIPIPRAGPAFLLVDSNPMKKNYTDR